ncbi:MAG TPA: nucleotidyltransferase domain-containing protein [Actinomycetes bacterium]|nr:nucleotidyltransferase domain-containing protein [Actinomycetes bacterium]
MDAFRVAAQVVKTRFPEAVAAVLAGSVARGTATDTSDLDIVVVLAGPPAPFRETLRANGWVVELFVNTPDSLEYWYGQDGLERRNSLADMVVQGIPLFESSELFEIKAKAAAIIASGPTPLSETERDDRRYALTDVLEDLMGTHDPDERDAIAGQALVLSAELALLVDRRWLGRGKWLIRRLREADPDLAHQLSAAHREVVSSGSHTDLVKVMEDVLARAGGPLTEGYLRQ